MIRPNLCIYLADSAAPYLSTYYFRGIFFFIFVWYYNATLPNEVCSTDVYLRVCMSLLLQFRDLHTAIRPVNAC